LRGARYGWSVPPVPDPLPDETDLTQYGQREPVDSEGEEARFADLPTFRNRVRDFQNPPEVDISLIRGRIGEQDAGKIVCRKYVRMARAIHAVRYTTAGELRSKGFIVTHSPTKRNPDHVSVEWRGDWTDEVSATFDTCFGTD
jgi:hypothetical protein